jgi:UV DNA damage endonuclease
MTDIRLGLCCLNTELREQKPSIFASRSCTLATIEKKGIDYCIQLANQNIDDLFKMVQWNRMNNISVFRLSSDIFPHITNQRIDLQKYQLDIFAKKLAKFGRYARALGQRLTFHPGQFNVLGTPNQKMLATTSYELHIHASILDYMGCDKDSVMVIHGGGVYGNKSQTMDRWCKNYLKLPKYVRDRLVLENCEKNFNIEDCLAISKRVGVPVVLDNHHFECYNIIHPEQRLKYSIDHYIPDVLETWRIRGIRPKFHISEQGAGKTGHHSDYIEEIPQYYLEIPEKYGVDIDIMVEAKMKERAIRQISEKYPGIFREFSD